jgi:two-component system chemotaxis response regulator CheY
MASPTILIVDDDAALRSLLSDGLTLLGFRVETAANGIDGLQAVERELPHIVLLDLQMPVLDGRGFARALAARGLHLPIIVMTGNHDGEHVAREVGATAYIKKPFDFDHMVNALERSLGLAA